MKVTLEFDPADAADRARAQALLDSTNDMDTTTDDGTAADDTVEGVPADVYRAIMHSPRWTQRRKQPCLDLCRTEQQDRGAYLKPGKDNGPIRCYAENSTGTGAYAVIHPSRAVLRLPAGDAEGYEYAYTQKNATYQVVVSTNTSEGVAEFHQLAPLAADRTRSGQ